MQIISGTLSAAQKIVIYGPEGIGKSTFASKFPNPLFIDTEGSTKKLDVRRLPKPSSWTMIMEQVRHVKATPGICDTLAIDTADWAEQLCISEICAKAQKGGIEDFGYGKGYVYLAEEFGRLLNLLEDAIDRGVNVVIAAHAQMRKFEQPDEMGSYDRWELKLQKKTAPLLMEWADTVLFANYKTYVVNVDGQGVQKGKNKVQGGQRVMFTSHHPCWDAKNRDDLKPELKFEFSEIAHIIPQRAISTATAVPTPHSPQSVVPEKQPESEPAPSPTPEPQPIKPAAMTQSAPAPAVNPKIPRALADLMEANGVLEAEIQTAVASKGYYPANTPIKNYDADFISGVLVAAWPQVLQMITALRNSGEIPF